MPYGTVKVDNIIFTEGGADRTITVSGLYASTSGNLTVTGTISGATVQATSGIITTVQTVTGIFGLGSAASPSITFSGDLDNGLYSPGANQVAISTSGTGRLFVDSLGRVGIGTASPSASLTVQGVGTDNVTLLVYNGTASNPTIISNAASASTLVIKGGGPAVSSNAGGQIDLVGGIGATDPGTIKFRTGTAVGEQTEKARIDASGRLLVGTSTSRNVGADFILQLEAEDASAGAAVIRHGGTTAASGPNVRFARSRGTTSGAVTAVAVGDTLGYLGWFGADGTDLGNEAANIRCDVANAVSSNIVPGDLVFSTTNSTGTSAEIVRMTGEGLVGINNNAPDSTLSVQNSSGGRIAKFIGTSAPFPITIDDQARILSGNSSSRAIVTEARVQIETTGAYALSVCNNAATNTGALITLGKSRSATVGGSTAVIANDVLGYLRFAGADGTDVNTIAADIRCDVDATVAANVVPGRLTFHTANSAGTLLERARITSDGYLRLAATNSLGIQFNGDTAAANALDDYEEGTWTVQLYDALTAGNLSATTATGYYTKVGRMVHATFTVPNISTVGLTAANVIHYTLPFTSVASIGYRGTADTDTVTFLAGRAYASAIIGASSARGYMIASGTGVTDANVLVNQISTGVSDVSVSISYYAA